MVEPARCGVLTISANSEIFTLHSAPYLPTHPFTIHYSPLTLHPSPFTNSPIHQLTYSPIHPLLFPNIPIPFLQVDVSDPAPFIDEGIEHPTHQAYYERAENRRPEPLNVEARHYSRSHFQKQGVYHKCEEAQGEDIYWKGDNDKYRPEKSIQYTEDSRGEKCGKETRHMYTVDQIGCNNN